MATKKTNAPYENNPFFIVTNGITLLVQMALGVGVLLLALSFFDYIRGATRPDVERTQSPAQMWESTVASTHGLSASDWALTIGAVAIIGLAALLLSALVGGISSYTSAQLAKGKRVSLRDAFRTAFDNLFSYLWLQIIIFVKLVLWSLLFILPGIYMAVRYSLAGVAFFDEKKNLRGNAAIKESFRLTKGAWITTFGAHFLLNALTLYIFTNIISTAANTVLYRQYSALGDKQKPATHPLSWIVLLLPITLLVLVITGVLAVLSTGGLDELVRRVWYAEG